MHRAFGFWFLILYVFVVWLAGFLLFVRLPYPAFYFVANTGMTSSPPLSAECTLVKNREMQTIMLGAKGLVKSGLGGMVNVEQLGLLVAGRQDGHCRTGSSPIVNPMRRELFGQSWGEIPLNIKLFLLAM